MVKLSQIEEYKKNSKKPAVFRRAWGLKCTQRGDFKEGVPLEAGRSPLPLFGICAASGCPEMTFLH